MPSLPEMFTVKTTCVTSREGFFVNHVSDECETSGWREVAASVVGSQLLCVQYFGETMGPKCASPLFGGIT